MAEALPPDPLIGEIRLFAGNFAPKDWAFCDGRLLKPRDYPVLFSLLGTTYGGDGVNTFAIPNLQGRVPVHEGGGLVRGQMGGVENVTLTETNLPKHTHAVGASKRAESDAPGGNVWGSTTTNIYADASDGLSLNKAALSSYGGSQSHENRIPYLAINYIMALKGSRPEETPGS